MKARQDYTRKRRNAASKSGISRRIARQTRNLGQTVLKWRGRLPFSDGSIRRTTLLIATWLVAVIAVYPRLFERRIVLITGKPSPVTIQAPEDFSIIDSDATKAERLKAASSVPMVFAKDHSIADASRKMLNRFFKQIAAMKNEKGSLSARAVALDDRLEVRLKEESLKSFLRSRRPDVIHKLLLDAVDEIYGTGIVDDDIQIKGDTVLLSFDESDELHPVSANWLLNRRQALKTGTARLRGLKWYYRRPAEDLLEEILDIDCRPDSKRRMALRNSIMERVKPVMRTYVHGQVIVRRGDLVTRNVAKAVEELNTLRLRLSREDFAGLGVLVLMLIGVTVLYLFVFIPGSLSSFRILIAMCLSLVMVLFASRFFISLFSERLGDAVGFVLPSSMLPMILGTLAGPQVAVAGAILSAALNGIMAHMSLEVGISCLAGGMTAVFALRHLRHRREYLLAFFMVSAVKSLVIGGFDFFTRSGWHMALWHAALGMGSVFVSVLGAFVLQMIFESMLEITTPMRLMELTDFNRGLLKRMAMEMQGTFNHCLMVGNLAETAADAIGADSLLARAGAYYHDIGKIRKPSYFIENQRTTRNIHEKLSANMASLVITSHVKDGVEIARSNHLPKEIRDIIREHHGTSLVSFFYQKAMEEGQSELLPEVFYRYPGPKPQTREAAIVMLADSVEAATRTLGNPTASSLRSLIRKIINSKFIDAQLDECDLTLKDLHKIAESFAFTLTGMFHTRVEYPDKNEKKETRNGHHGKEQPG